MRPMPRRGTPGRAVGPLVGQLPPVWSTGEAEVLRRGSRRGFRRTWRAPSAGRAQAADERAEQAKRSETRPAHWVELRCAASPAHWVELRCAASPGHWVERTGGQVLLCGGQVLQSSKVLIELSPPGPTMAGAGRCLREMPRARRFGSGHSTTEDTSERQTTSQRGGHIGDLRDVVAVARHEGQSSSGDDTCPTDRGRGRDDLSAGRHRAHRRE